MSNTSNNQQINLDEDKECWGYDPRELLGILGTKNNSRSSSPVQSTLRSFIHERGSEKDDLEIIISSESIPILEGKNCELTLDYLQSLFEETKRLYENAWKNEPKRPIYEELIVNSFREYCVDCLTREWHCLMEFWGKKKEISSDDILAINEKLNELSHVLTSKSQKSPEKWNIMYQKENSLLELTRKEDGIYWYNRNCWEKEISRVEKHIAINHERFGLISVPKICKVKIPCGQNDNFSYLEIGIDEKGQAVAVKHIKRNFSIAKMEATVSSLRYLKHPHILTSYLSPGPNYVLTTPLMNSNLGQLIMFLSSNGMLAKRSLTIVKQMMDGIIFLQTRNPAIIHGNLKPTNIFINCDGLVQIAEFGFNLELSIAPLSSLIWRSPEQVLCCQSGQRCRASLEADIASAGMLMHFVLSGGRHPFGNVVSQILYNLAEGNVELTVKNLTSRDLLLQMMAASHERSNIHQVSRHIFWWSLKEQWQLVQKCIECHQHEITGQSLLEYLKKETQNLIADDQAILFSKGGIHDTKNDLSEFIWLIQNFPAPFHMIQHSIPNIPLRLYQILNESHWAKYEQFGNIFENRRFKF